MPPDQSAPGGIPTVLQKHCCHLTQIRKRLHEIQQQHGKSLAAVRDTYQQLHCGQGNQKEVKRNDPPLKLQKVAVVGCKHTQHVKALMRT